MDKVAIITVTYNSGKVIADFLTSYSNLATENVHLIIIDSGSTDDTLKIISDSISENMKLVTCGTNVGIAKGNNIGIDYARSLGSTHVLLLNNDTEYPSGLVDILLRDMYRLDADMIVPKIMYFDPSDTIWCAGGYFNKWKTYQNQHRGEGEKDIGQYNVSVRINYAPTCCMLVKMDVFDEIGTFDENYFVYFDDTDFVLRTNRNFKRLWYTPSVEIAHKVSSLTGGEDSEFSIYICTRNKIYFLRKNFSSLVKFVFLSMYMVRVVFKYIKFGRVVHIRKKLNEAVLYGFTMKYRKA